MSRTLENTTDLHCESPTAGIDWPNKVDVIGVHVSEATYDDAVESITRAAKAGEPGIVSCHAVHAIVTMSCDGRLLNMVNQFHMITPDGQPVRWAMNLLNRSGLKDRVYGPELMLRLCERAERDQLPIYLYGGNDQVSDDLSKALTEKFPRLILAGAEAPPFRPLTEEESDQVVKRINDSGARLIFIGLGCPKQDIFAFQHRERLKGFQVCVGAAFDFHSGAKTMAPNWMQSNGMEWIFRLYKEPSRLWKRYLYTNTLFVWKVAIALVSSKNRRQ